MTLGLRVLPALLAAAALAAAASTSDAHASAGACSVANASAAATAAGFHTIDFPDRKTRIIGLVCGPFFGPGSSGMAGMVPTGAGCGVSVGWLVFRFDGGRWRVVMKQKNGAQSLQAVGSDIRETQGYPRAGDPMCRPSRIRTRIWHWNGTSFVVSAWIVTRAKAVSYARFRSPDGNLACEFHAGGFDDVACVSVDPPRYVMLIPDGRRDICLHRHLCEISTTIFSSDGSRISRAPVLACGQKTSRYGIITCDS